MNMTLMRIGLPLGLWFGVCTSYAVLPFPLPFTGLGWETAVFMLKTDSAL